MESNSTELRILSGIHSGATVPTAEVAVTIGSDSTCQVILADPGILPKHAQVTITGEQWTLEGLDDGDIEKQAYAFGDIVWLSTVAITVDQVQNPWPQKITPPKRHTPAKKKPEEDNNTAEKQEGADKKEEAQAIVVDKSIAASKPANMSDQLLLKIQQGPTSLILIVVSVIFLLLASTLAAYVFHRKEAYEHTISAADRYKALAEQAQRILNTLQEPQVKASSDMKGHISISGWVKNEETLDRIKRAFLKFQPEPTFALFAEDKFQQAVNTIVTKESKTIQARFPKPGIVALNGFGQEAEIAHVTDTITSMVPGVKTVYYDQVSEPANIAEAFQKQAIHLGLSMLTLHFDGKTMHAHGTLTSSQIAIWENLLSTFQKKYGNLLAVEAVIDEMPDALTQNKVQALRTDEHSPEYGAYGIHSVVGGLSKYVIMNDGRVVTVGGRIGQFRLSDITLDTVVLDGPQHLVIHR